MSETSPSTETWARRLIADRFDIERVAGSGGMGIVYRAVDHLLGKTVALKMPRDPHSTLCWRLLQEGTILSQIEHPNIVRHVAHGQALCGTYVAMEWLEGETLAERLLRGPLTIAESVELIETVAGALAVLHAAGVVHRDIKPANLFLVGRQLAGVRIMDFGLARHARYSRPGDSPIGTPFYTPPEQAAGGTVDERADVFALGAVLFECLTGRRAFLTPRHLELLGGSEAGALAHVRDFRADVPDELAALAERMLSIQPEDRPASGTAVVAALRSLRLTPERRPRRGISRDERRLLSIVRVMPGERLDKDARRELAEICGAHGGAIELMPDGAWNIVVVGPGPAVDRAATVARCVLHIARRLPDAAIAVVTGLGVVSRYLTAGAILDGMTALAPQVAPGTIEIDDTTAELLDADFDVRREDGRAWLAGDGRRRRGPVLPLIGRQRELTFLGGMFEDCLGAVSGAALVSGASGSGKTRLLDELMARLAAHPRRPQVWTARGGDGIGGPVSLLAQMIRRACRLPDDSTRAEAQLLILRHLEARMERTRAPRVARSLAMLAGYGDVGHSDHAAATMVEERALTPELETAWLEWIACELAEPLVLVLDDAHHADGATLRLLADTIRAFESWPLLIVLASRLEAAEPIIVRWGEPMLLELRLAALPGHACSVALKSRGFNEIDAKALADRAQGHAFLLEKLAHAGATSRSRVPPVAEAIVAAQLERNEPEARRVLRAASLLADAVTSVDLEPLLDLEPPFIVRWLEVLADRGVLERDRDGARSYRFHDALHRDVVRSQLTEADRVRGGKKPSRRRI